MTEQAVAPGHVLVVDEQRLLIELARSFLEGAGYRVSHAPTREAALELFAHSGVDVVLMPLAAPDEPVIATYRALRALPPQRDGRIAAFVFVLERELPTLR